MSARRIAEWLLALGFATLGLYWYPQSWSGHAFIASLYDALAASLIAISITVLLIDHANEQRDRRQLKKRLIWEMGSSDQAFAIRAVKELRDAGWLTDGSLEGVDLTLANLAKAQLPNARLKGVVLSQSDLNATNLEGADLRNAHLEGAVAGGVNVRKAQIGGANLREARLHNANLEEIDSAEAPVDMLNAKLVQASLRGARLRNARLEECDFLQADFTGCDLSEAVLLRANMKGAVMNEVILERADLSELQNWEEIASFRNAKIGGIRNAPAGFREWAVTQGALEAMADAQADAKPAKA